jgi:hypothetical protein
VESNPVAVPLQPAGGAARPLAAIQTIWLIGASLFAAWLLVQALSTLLAFRGRRPVTGEAVLELLEDCKAGLEVGTYLAVVETPRVKVHWFNPLVWLAFHKARTDMELACDELVLSRLRDRESSDYGNTILELLDTRAEPKRLPVLAAIAEDAHQVKRRMNATAPGQTRPPGRSRRKTFVNPRRSNAASWSPADPDN